MAKLRTIRTIRRADTFGKDIIEEWQIDRKDLKK